MSPALTTIRTVAWLALIGGGVLLGVCLFNPRGMYQPRELTYGLCVGVILASGIALAYVRSQVPGQKRPKDEP